MPPPPEFTEYRKGRGAYGIPLPRETKKISERALMNGSPGDFFVSEEVLEMLAGFSKSAEGAENPDQSFTFSSSSAVSITCMMSAT